MYCKRTHRLMRRMSHKPYYLKAIILWLACVYRRGGAGFQLDGQSYRYFSHRYNLTWLNERRVEVPVIRRIVAANNGSRILEVGNVLSHYDPGLTHPVVDKYEKSSRLNLFMEDAETFSSDRLYDLVFSISTLEHVGWDESPRDESKVYHTVCNLRRLLAPGGELVFTAPIGYSPPLDRLIDNADGFIQRLCLRRLNVQNEWEEADWTTARHMKFHTPHPFANGLVIARVRPLRASL